MIYKKIKLNKFYPILGNSDATLTIFCYQKNKEQPKEYKRYPLLILPGGAYYYCSVREKEPVAFAFLAQGFNCFVLDYSCNKKYPQPQLEVACAMDFIESNVNKLNMYPNSKSMVGFSAGGHLASSYSCYYKEFAKTLKLATNKIKPIYQILCYPVITCMSATSGRTRDIITQKDESLFETLSVEKHITSSYTPTYLWTTKEDNAVPYEINSGAMYKALQKNNVLSIYKLYERGAHGRSVATNETEANHEVLKDYLYDIQDWVKDAVKFFNKEIIK